MQNPLGSILVIGLVVLGAVLVVAGLFLPALTCDAALCAEYGTPPAHAKASGDERIVLMDFKDFDPGEGAEGKIGTGIFWNHAEIMLMVMAGMAVAAAVSRRGILPVGLTMLGFTSFLFFLVWDTVDQLVALHDTGNFTFGYAWILLLFGPVMVCAGGALAVLLFPEHPPTRHYAGGYGYYQQQAYYQQQPYYQQPYAPPPPQQPYYQQPHVPPPPQQPYYQQPHVPPPQPYSPEPQPPYSLEPPQSHSPAPPQSPPPPAPSPPAANQADDDEATIIPEDS